MSSGTLDAKDKCELPKSTAAWLQTLDEALLLFLLLPSQNGPLLSSPRRV